MLLIEVRDPVTKKLLFQYDPVNETVWIKHKGEPLREIHLPTIRAAHEKQIQSYLTTR